MFWKVASVGVVIAIAVTLLATTAPKTRDTIDYSSAPPWPVFTVAGFLTSLLRGAANSLMPPAIRVLERAFDINQMMVTYCCTKAGWPDVLHEGQKSGRALAAHANLSKRMTRRLLRACVAADVFRELTSSDENVDDDARLYVNTPLGDILREGHPFSMKPYYHHQIEDVVPSMAKLWDAAKDETSLAFSLAHSVSDPSYTVWDYFRDHPEQGSQFNKAMTSVDALGTAALVLDFPWGTHCASVVDVGGGRGSLMASILRAHPHLTGVLFDQASVIEQARRYWEGNHGDILGRARFAGGSFFDADTIPRAEGDAACYVSKGVLHDWDDESVDRIVGNVAGAMRAGDRYILLEAVQVVPEHMRDRVLLDIQMMTIGGRERTVADFRRILAAAGLQLDGTRPTRSIMTVVEASK